MKRLTITKHLEFLYDEADEDNGRKDILVIYTEKQEVLGKLLFTFKGYSFIITNNVNRITPEINKEIDNVLTELNSTDDNIAN